MTHEHWDQWDFRAVYYLLHMQDISDCETIGDLVEKEDNYFTTQEELLGGDQGENRAKVAQRLSVFVSPDRIIPGLRGVVERCEDCRDNYQKYVEGMMRLDSMAMTALAAVERETDKDYEPSTVEIDCREFDYLGVYEK